MADKHAKDIDRVTGVETTGHEWDGLKELNNPLPKWWLYTFYACVVWGLGYTVFYPAWPMITTATAGVLGYSTRAELETTLAEARSAQAQYLSRLEAMEIDAIAADRELMSFATAGGAAVFRTNCSQCHGSGAAGGVGYPNLLDDDWIWGGSREEILHTITHGIRQTGPDGWETADTRQSQMPAYGRDQILEPGQIDAVIQHVRRISGQSVEAAADTLAEGAVVFEENCAACHGEDGKGLRELGAPNLTDAIWLYGGDVASLETTLHTGRGGMMPAWNTRLSDAALKQVALYVHALGGGE